VLRRGGGVEEMNAPTPAEVERALKRLKRELERPAFAKAVEATAPPRRKHRPGYRPRPNYAGLRYWARARATGRYVAIVNGEEAGLDTDAGPWTVFCDDHGYTVAVETFALARTAATRPQDWCGKCGNPNPDPDAEWYEDHR